MDTKKLHALITLLDDPSVEIYSTVESELLKEQVEIVPELEKAWEISVDDLFQKRVENIIHSLQFGDIEHAMREWLQSGSKDLLHGVYLVAKYQYPALSYAEVRGALNVLKQEIWMELNDHLTSLEKVKIINHILFDNHQFTRNTKQFLSPQNNYINEVLKSKMGNPISLSIIYSIICQDLGIPVYGVNLPKNFILAFMDEIFHFEDDDGKRKNSAMFYINPINKGAILGKQEIEFFIKQQKLVHQDSYYMPCANEDIVKRLLNNLRFAYDNIGNDAKKEEVKRLMVLFEKPDK